MRGLVMAAAAALMMGASAFAQKPNLSREPFVISVGKLSEYLQLTSTQIEEVANMMKKALTAEQYRKYVTLINVTNNNNRMLAEDSMPDVYLAENAK